MRRLLPLLFLAMSMRAAQAGRLVENVAARNDATQTYTLFLPSSYDASRPSPLLLVFDPRGRGTTAAEIFRPGAEELGWILISANGTRSDTTTEPNERALRALMPEIDRYPVDPKRIYAAGFSGMAVLSWAVGVNTGKFAGVIGVGGRLVGQLPPQKFAFAHYGFAGIADFNNREMRVLDDQLEEAHRTHRFEEFDGRHEWMDSARAKSAMTWMEVIAMKEQRRAHDEALIDRAFAADVMEAAKLAGKDALRRYRAIARTYDGLRPIEDVRAAIARLEHDPAVSRDSADEAKWDRFEEQYTKDVFEKMGNAYAAAREAPRPNLARHFRIADLEKRAARGGAEGRAARRLLEAAFAQTSFYLPPQLFARGEYALAAATLEVALAIHPESAAAWYNLGAACARGNDRRRALESLEKAVANGFRDHKLLASDDDYASVRGEARFQEVLAGLASRSQ